MALSIVTGRCYVVEGEGGKHESGVLLGATSNEKWKRIY